MSLIMEIKKVNSKDFNVYGKIINLKNSNELIEAMENTPLPEDVIYVPSDKVLEELDTYKQMSKSVYGDMPVQIGYCNGHNSKLNALEYHRDSEINIAATDMILMLGLLTDVSKEHTYDTANVKAFLVPAGTAVEVYATTLHYAPCGVDGNGFQVAVVLPKGTNYPLTSKHTRVHNNIAESEDALLAAANKWLIGHAEGGLDDTAFIGLKGVNLDINE